MYQQITHQSYYEIQGNIERLVSQTKILLKNRGKEEECQLLNSASISCILTDHDNWNGGIDFYTIYIQISIRLYSGLSNDKKDSFCKIIADAVNEIEPAECYGFSCRIEPKLSADDLDWDSVGGIEIYNKCRDYLVRMKQLLIDVGTNTITLKGSSFNNEYIHLHHGLSDCFNKLNYTFSGLFRTLWEWHRFYKEPNNNLSSYQSRRLYIDNLFRETETLLRNSPQNKISETVKIDDWEEIERRMIKIKKAVSNASDIEDFQSIGLQCRELIISIAKTVYNPDLHGLYCEDGIPIGESDAVRQLANYIKQSLKGKENEELRSYAKATNKVANALTHRRTSTKTEMLLCVNATVALINFIGILEGKSWSY